MKLSGYLPTEPAFVFIVLQCLYSRLSVTAFQFQFIDRVYAARGGLSRDANNPPALAPGFGMKKQRFEKNCFSRHLPIGFSSVDESEPDIASAATMEFTTPEMLVYIEDTDSYGVMYNSNYVRAYDRALHMISISDRGSNNDGVAKSVLDHEGWSLVKLDKQKFKSSPPLGGSFCVTGKLTSRSDVTEVWDLEMKQQNKNGGSDSDVVYNSATVTIARPDLTTTCIPKPDPLQEKNPNTAEHKFMLYRDEFDAHLPTHLPLRNVLNLFERSRSNFLGGPESLRRMQDEGLLWVVTGNEQCSLVNLGTTDDNETIQASPGQIVTVRTNFVPRRRGMLVECRHSLLMTDQNGENRRLAQGIVNIMAIDAETRRPTSNLPEWVRNGIFSNEQ